MSLFARVVSRLRRSEPSELGASLVEYALLLALIAVWDLADDARAHAHAHRMMEKQEVYTNPNVGSATSGWNALAEVVGVGPSVSSLFNAFMSSSSRRGTILGPYNYVGAGVAEDDDGILWVSMICMNGPDGLVDPPANTTTTTSEGPATTTTTAATTTTGAPGATTTTSKAPSNGDGEPSGNGSGGGGTGTGTGGGSSATDPPQATSTTIAGGEPESSTAVAASSTTETSEPTPGTASPAAAAGGPAQPPAIGASSSLRGDETTLFGGWIIAGIVGLVAIALLLLAIPKRERDASATLSSVRPGVKPSINLCQKCGLSFDHAALALCPSCGKAH